MAENGLPAGLEMLKIDLKRDLDDFGVGSEIVNPFSAVDSGTRKKLKTESVICSGGEKQSCPRGLFGSGCVESARRSASATCRCRVYVPTKLRNHDKRSGVDGSLLQLKSGSISKRNILQKGKLNFLKSHDVTKQSCQQLESLTQNQGSKLKNRQVGSPSNESDSIVNSSKCPVENQATDTEYVPDFQSLIPSSQKQISSDISNTVFNTTSFRSFQNNNVPCRCYSSDHSNDKNEEDDLVNSVSRKLSVTGIASNSNASCSQEARLTANVYCDEHDISIDELASYFEDFVHIPKKMSLMAEQMYI